MTSITYTILSLPSNEKLLSRGEMNIGHDDLSCESCHTPARGNVFQQLQANIMFTLGMRKTSVSFGTEDVDTKKCLECHDRENDRHPLHRFEEPRFLQARTNLNVTECESCHLEHKGSRITQANIGYCVNCHEDTKLNNDPLEVRHDQLIEQGMWSTCLQCHDFHGNHVYNVPHSMSDTLALSTIREYLKGGISPYSDLKKFYPLKEEDWRKKYDRR